ncbi:hypothetical protein WICPIJ_009460 [Wickerhamomyces pijperi]|uniref:Copper-fist domain-containing protein n=1 Tax=Wickerhamomyces pijperi TaxID=599730 RepID=A0A9P8PNL7_WICPI|nr:hypothetical protein WICPIJ_009460 [Wickerhamomyces pijperi]
MIYSKLYRMACLECLCGHRQNTCTHIRKIYNGVVLIVPDLGRHKVRSPSSLPRINTPATDSFIRVTSGEEIFPTMETCPLNPSVSLWKCPGKKCKHCVPRQRIRNNIFLDQGTITLELFDISTVWFEPFEQAPKNPTLEALKSPQQKQKEAEEEFQAQIAHEEKERETREKIVNKITKLNKGTPCDHAGQSVATNLPDSVHLMAIHNFNYMSYVGVFRLSANDIQPIVGLLNQAEQQLKDERMLEYRSPLFSGNNINSHGILWPEPRAFDDFDPLPNLILRRPKYLKKPVVRVQYGDDMPYEYLFRTWEDYSKAMKDKVPPEVPLKDLYRRRLEGSKEESDAESDDETVEQIQQQNAALEDPEFERGLEEWCKHGNGDMDQLNRLIGGIDAPMVQGQDVQQSQQNVPQNQQIVELEISDQQLEENVQEPQAQEQKATWVQKQYAPLVQDQEQPHQQQCFEVPNGQFTGVQTFVPQQQPTAIVVQEVVTKQAPQCFVHGSEAAEYSSFQPVDDLSQQDSQGSASYISLDQSFDPMVNDATLPVMDNDQSIQGWEFQNMNQMGNFQDQTQLEFQFQQQQIQQQLQYNNRVNQIHSYATQINDKLMNLFAYFVKPDHCEEEAWRESLNDHYKRQYADEINKLYLNKQISHAEAVQYFGAY